MFESHSNHIRFYQGQASRKSSFLFSLLLIIPEAFILWLFIPLPSETSPTKTAQYIEDHFTYLLLLCGCVNILAMFVFTQKRVRIAKEALGGTLVAIEPRFQSFEGIGILTMVHPNDTEIGKPIHMKFDEHLKRGDVLFLKGANITGVKKETYTWTQTVESYSPYGDHGRDGGYGYGGGQREISGTSVRIHTTLIHDGITYSGGNFNAKKGDVLDVLVVISAMNESGASVRHRKTLSLTSNNYEEE